MYYKNRMRIKLRGLRVLFEDGQKKSHNKEERRGCEIESAVGDQGMTFKDRIVTSKAAERAISFSSLYIDI